MSKKVFFEKSVIDSDPVIHIVYSFSAILLIPATIIHLWINYKIALAVILLGIFFGKQIFEPISFRVVCIPVFAVKDFFKKNRLFKK